MTIETKYSIGDEVWCNIYNGKKLKITAGKLVWKKPDIIEALSKDMEV